MSARLPQILHEPAPEWGDPPADHIRAGTQLVVIDAKLNACAYQLGLAVLGVSVTATETPNKRVE